MAPPTGTLRVWRYFTALLAILAVLYLIVFWPGARHTPKLGIDLAGGTEVIFKAKTPDGKQPSSGDMSTAKAIMTERVNGTGVTQSTVAIQGSDQLVITIPGKQDNNVAQLGAAAELNFRGLVAPPIPIDCTSTATSSSSASTTPSATTSASTSPSGSTTPSSSTTSSQAATKPSASDSAKDYSDRPLTASTPSSTATTSGKATTSATPSGTGTTTGSATSTATPSASSTSSAPPPKCSSTSVSTVAAAGKFTVPTVDTAFDSLSSSNQELLEAGLSGFDCNSVSNEHDVATKYFIACMDGGQLGDTPGSAYAVLLGPVIVAGRSIASASAVAPNISGGGSSTWTVGLTLKGSANTAWAKYTGAHNLGSTSETPASATSCSSSATPCADYVGFTLDGIVVSLPANESTINGGTTQISGSFTQSSAKSLADQLKYGALPLSFTLESSEPVSATLGSSQLKAGLLAGGIGLILVVLYSLLYYRALGLVTIASLLVSGALTYGSLVMLATQINFTLSLAGIAGFIVAVGITADSFVVFFERMKDEVHEGRSARVAVPRAWVRARRTILSADTVSFLAAAILYYFAAGDVRGFAFTLGLSTILDLIVVFLFTHPLISFLSRFPAFGSARFTGLDAVRGGPAVSETAAAERAASPRRRGSASQVQEERPSAGTVTLDKPAEAPADDTDVEADVDEDASTESAVESADGSGDDEPRRRTAPEPGSAAERAAARRARMREQRNDDGKGES